MNGQPAYTLGIETATLSGGICLLRGEEKLGEWAGDNTAQLSSELLPQIADLLSQNRLAVSDLSLLAVCTGPGSFTGLRIGLSTAKAFQLAHRTPASPVTLPAAMVFAAAVKSSDGFCVIPAGRTEAYVQRFAGGSVSGEISVQKIANIPAMLSADDVCIVTADVKPDEVEMLAQHTRTLTSGQGIAESIARLAVINGAENSGELLPVYAREAVTNR